MKGTGLTTMSKKGINSSELYIPFGTKMINRHRLYDDDIVQLRYQCGSNIKQFPSKKISRKCSNVLRKLITNTNPRFEDLSSLNEDERRYIYNLIKYTRIHGHECIPTPNKDEETQFMDRFHFLLGQIRAGNNSKDLVKELKLKLVKMRNDRLLPKSEINAILYDLLDLGY